MLQTIKDSYKRWMIGRLRRQDAERRAELPGGFGGLPPSQWGFAVDPGGELSLEGIPVRKLAAEWGTPLHIVYLPWLRKTHDDFIGAFRATYPNVQLGTSYKTNPVPGVLRELHRQGTLAEVISEFEFWLARRLGVDGSRIIVNGPGKGRRMIAQAVQDGARIINVDRIEEIDLVASEAQRAGRVQPVGVRVVTSVGWSSQFGLSLAGGEARQAYEKIAGNPWLRAAGVHLHIGTGLKSVDNYLQAIREVVEFSREIERQHRIVLEFFDLGGGFGVPTVRALDDWDGRMMAFGHPAREAIPSDCPRPADYASRIAAMFRQSFAGRTELPEIVLEPGRAITSGAQTLCLSVVGTKGSMQAPKLILDGGKNITMPLGWETHKIFPVTKLNEDFSRATDLYGPLCHPGDVVARHLPLPALANGDVVAIMDAGAYFIPNQMNFSNPRPAIVAVDTGGVVREMRRRESFQDVVRLDELPPE